MPGLPACVGLRRPTCADPPASARPPAPSCARRADDRRSRRVRSSEPR
ncbi:hypothetical protein APASM_4946 [Actinosynnema pretiosum subsp. pretiosum]|nr:hypothetical protein APASM_4946 [Actinosynnema pretiosum subsp. pretiosum]